MADTATKQSPCPGPAPFNQPSADIVLRTQDGVDFRVHTQILAQASPFFATMLSLPQPPRFQRSDADSPPDVPTSAKPAGGAAPDTITSAPHAVPDPDAVPVVDVSEDSAPLELLLRILYPIRKPPMDDPDTLVPAIKAAHKFEMEWPVQVLSERLADVVRTPDVAIRVWASACRTGLEDVARMAALVLRQSKERTGPGSATGATEATKPPAALACVEGLGKMEGISGGHYFRLKRFLLANQAQVADGSLKLLTPLPKVVDRCKPSARVLFSTDIPNTDVLCRSTLRDSDGRFALYAAHQSVLSVSSPVVKAQLDKLRSPDEKTRTTYTVSDSDSELAPKPELTFDTDPDTLAALLNTCYDHYCELSCGPDEIARLLVAADKLGFRMVASRARERWSLLAGVNPLSAYLVAAHHRLRSEAQAAAKLVLKSSTLVVDRYVEVLEGSSALAYHRLLQYHDSYRELLRAKVAAAAQTLPECVVVVSQSSKHHDVLKTTSIRDALQRPGVLADRLCLRWNPRQAVKTAFTESLEECSGRYPSPKIDLCKFMKAALEMVVDLPEDIKTGIDGMRLELE